jgi:hypothetical protein
MLIPILVVRLLLYSYVQLQGLLFATDWNGDGWILNRGPYPPLYKEG